MSKSIVRLLKTFYLKNRYLKRPMAGHGVDEPFVNWKVTILHLLKDTIFISLGILAAGFGLKGFLLPNGFIDGGVTGISLLSERRDDKKTPI